MTRFLVLAVGLSLSSAAAEAAVLRYLLVVGNNHGVDANGVARPTLAHAEREAGELHQALLAHGGFTSEPRSILLRGAPRRRVHEAIAELAAQIERDRAAIPSAEVLFAFFYSGHGSEGNLLLPDGPLPGSELAASLKRIPADVRIGVFDACAAASLSPAMITAKGMKPVPAFDLLTELPTDSLNAEGSIWMFSSRADEVSIEDKQLGGVFTHFFIEGLTRAGGNGRTITLDAVWDYASTRTVGYTGRLGLTQTPSRTTHTVNTGPLELAWRDRRRATLVLAEDLESRIALFYAGDLLMMFDKVAGQALEKSVPIGRIDVMIFDGDTTRTRQLTLASGDRVIVSKGGDEPPSGLGRTRRAVTPKGSLDLHDKVFHERDGTTFSLGVDYRHGVGSDVLLVPQHALGLEARLDIGSLWVSGALAYAWDQRTFGAWGYESAGLSGRVRVGHHLTSGTLLVGPIAAFELGSNRQVYDDGTERSALFGTLGAGVTAAIQWAGVGFVELELVAGSRRGLGVGAAAEALWAFGFDLGIALLVTL